MKLINEKGKLFGIINIVDLIILLMVIAMVAAVATQVLGSRVQAAVSPQVECTMEVSIIGTAPRLLREIERQDLAGEQLVSGNEYMNAYIEEVWFEDYITQAVRDDGIIVKIKTTVPKGTASPKIGSQEMRAGRTFIVKTQTFECSGTIRYVEIDEE